jgi:hypothetical protein
MVYNINQTIYNIIKNGNYLYNSRYAALVACNSQLSALLNTIQTTWPVGLAVATINGTFLTTGGGAALIPDLLNTDLTVLLASTHVPPLTFTFIPDTSAGNAARAIANALIQTNYCSGVSTALPSPIGLSTSITNGVPSIGGAAYPVYEFPAAPTFIAMITAMGVMLPEIGISALPYTASTAASSLAYAVIGSILGSIDVSLASLSTAIVALNTKFSTVAYSPSADAGLPAAIAALQAAANAINTRLALEITTYNSYVTQVLNYNRVEQLLISFQNPKVREIVQSVTTNPNLNPDLYTALLNITNSSTH